MYLSKLKIFGFKSFAQRVEVNFPGNGLTSVVGPNGCGKSNIVDAIRWVMGEQRASQLRSSKMQDVIFSGTEDRPPMNMAEVSLFIQNDRGILPSEYTEIQITRRAHRSGESEYLINNQDCRLRDIQNLFFDTGMGAASYSLMEQRMIDAILSDKAEDRRSLFEEAAGVSKYKQQRRETLRQLDRVRLDMERVEDNLRHARLSVRQHEKQVARAEEWKRVRDRLRGLELSMALDKFRESREHFHGFVKAQQGLESEREALQTRLTLLESRIEEKRLSISGDEEVYRELERSVGQMGLDVNDIGNQIQRLRDRDHLLQQNLEQAQREEQDASGQMEQLQAQRSAIEAEQPLLGEQLEASAREMERLQESRGVLRDLCEELREQVRAVSERRMKILQERNQLMGARERQLAGASHMRDRRLQLEAENQSQGDLLQGLEREHGELHLRVESDAELLEQARERQLQSQSRLEEAREGTDDFQRELRILQTETVQKRSRLEVLQAMVHSHEGMTGGSRHLLETHASSVRGILAEHIQVASAHTSAVEFCLGEALQTVLATDSTSPRDLLQILEAAQAGSALVAPQNPAPVPAPSTPTGDGILGAAMDFVEVDISLRPVVQSILGRWVLVADRAAAFRAAANNSGSDFWFCAPGGGLAVHACGLVRGGSAGSDSGTGILARRREIEELSATVAELEGRLQHLQLQLEQAQERQSEAATAAEQAQEDLRELDLSQRQAVSSLQVVEARLQTARSRAQQIADSLAEIDRRETEFQVDPAQDAFFAQAEREAQELEGQNHSLTERLREQEFQLESCNEDIMDAQKAHQELVSRGSTSGSRLQSIGQQLGSLEQLVRMRRASASSAREELDGIAQELRTFEEKLELQTERLMQEEVRRDEAKEHYDVLAVELEDWRAETRVIHTSLHQKTTQLHEVEMRLGTLRTNLERLKERMFEAWEVDLENPEGFEPIEYDESEANREARDLREQLKRIGPVGPGVLEDFEAEKKRLEDVERQFEDLDKARASLERTIARLDRIARERFLETFRQIQRNFQDVFSSLMVGGEARLGLADDADPLEGDIEVNARPTGKKMRGVRALSGGERALTATALLFALYMVKPSPFCILDEVDGPLDDANIGRFVGLLRRFSRQTQFIIVTHNKRTMAASDMLYGVTQEIKGISRIASVKVDEAVGLVR